MYRAMQLTSSSSGCDSSDRVRNRLSFTDIGTLHDRTEKSNRREEGYSKNENAGCPNEGWRTDGFSTESISERRHRGKKTAQIKPIK